MSVCARGDSPVSIYVIFLDANCPDNHLWDQHYYYDHPPIMFYISVNKVLVDYVVAKKASYVDALPRKER